MSSTGPTSSTSNVQLIIDALAEYAQITGMDLSQNPFAITLEQSNSSEVILQLLQGRARTLKEYRDGDRTLISCLSPAVKVFHAFSGILSEVVSMLPISPASALFVAIYVLLDAASGITSSYDAVLDLFECLGIFLKHLEIYTTIPSTPVLVNIMLKIMVELLLVLALATKQIKQGRFRKLLRESEIDAVLQRLDRLTQDEARMTVAQTLSVVLGLVSNMKVVVEDDKAPMDSMISIRQNLVALHQVIKKMNKMKHDQLRDVRYWLSPPDPSMNYNLVRRARHSGSAAWFFESNTSTEWKARGSLLWIHGEPGSGKSTLLSAIIEDIEGMVAAGLAKMGYYYFDFRDVKKQNCYGLLSSLIFQLSVESDSCYNMLSQLYSANSHDAQNPTIGTLKKCMTDMLSLPGQGPIYIIVDALDECPNFSGIPFHRMEVLELIEELADLKLPNVHLCVASRPEEDIRTVLEPLTSLKIALHDESGHKEDIIKYIKSIVRSNSQKRGWREEDRNLAIDTLSRNAGGMFRLAFYYISILYSRFPASIRNALADLPKSLDEIYERMLLDIDKRNRGHVRHLFGCLEVSLRPLQVDELAEIFAIQFDTTALPSFHEDLRVEDAIHSVLSASPGFIIIPYQDYGTQNFQFSHYSAKEFLTSKRLATSEEHLSYYHILPEPAHTTFAHACLSVLLQLDDQIDENIIHHFPLAQYAARYWVDHARFRNVSSHIQKAMEPLFDPARPHFSAWVWLYDIDRDGIEPMSTMHPTRPEAGPLYYASLCGFGDLVERLIVTHSLDVNSRGGSHTTPIHAASVKGNLEVASLLLKYGADPNSFDTQGMAPLHRVSQSVHLATMQPSLEISRLLVSFGANVNITDDQGETPLHVAARGGYRDIVQLLLGSGASLDVQNRHQETPLDLACGNGKLDVSRCLIGLGSDVDSRNKHGFIPLHTASRHGHLDISRLLLDSGSDANARETQRCTPLHYASQYGYLGLARLLIDRGADVDLQEIDRRTALHFASHRGYLEIARLLIERGADACARDDDGWTPFHAASYSGHFHVAEFLLKCAIDVDIRNGNGETSLYLASGSGKLDVVRFLIEQGADINVTDNNKWNPVHIASHNGHLDVVQMLINAGTPVDILNGTQKTPLALASMRGKVEVGRFLIEQGADVNARDKQSRAPLHLAAQYGHPDMVRLLLDHGVDLNIPKSNLWSPLHLASAHGHIEVAEILVRCCAGVDVFNSKQETPLHLAAGNGKIEIALLLIDHGADLHIINSNDWTPLHAASRRGHLGVVKLLLRRGADVDALNKTSKTAAELASENDKAKVVKFIAAYKADAHKCSTTLDTPQYGADEDGKDEEKTSFDVALAEGNIDVMKSLLERGVDINGLNARHETPLGRAAAEGNVNAVRLLVEAGAEMESRDMLGWTPLHSASRFGHLEVSRVLIDHGANANARNHDHWTPMHLSADNGHLGIVKLLLENGADVHALDNEGQTPHQISLTSGCRETAGLIKEHVARNLRKAIHHRFDSNQDSEGSLA